jgi:hypothetical protein
MEGRGHRAFAAIGNRQLHDIGLPARSEARRHSGACFQRREGAFELVAGDYHLGHDGRFLPLDRAAGQAQGAAQQPRVVQTAVTHRDGVRHQLSELRPDGHDHPHLTCRRDHDA